MRPGARTWLPQRLVERIGAALVAPRRALAAAEEASGNAQGGGAARTGSDVAWLIALSVVAASTREVLAALWLVAAGSVRDGIAVLMSILSRAAAMDLVFLLVAGVGITLLAGRRRSLGRDLDLAFVAYVPIAFVRLGAELLLASTGWPLTDTVRRTVGLLAYGWAGAILILGWRTARARAGADVAGARAAGGTDAGDAGGPAPQQAAEAAHRVRGPVHVAWAGRLVLGLALALVAVHAATIARDLASVRPVMAGDAAPGFHVRAIDERGQVSADGVRLEELRGQVVLVDFWATWCGPCVEALPAVDGLHRRYGEQGLAVVSVNTDDPARARALAQKLGLALALYADDGRAAHDYKVTTVPHLVLIDAHGRIQSVQRGLSSKDALAAEIERLLAHPAH
jgi:thiol-disulfide isomerase/thioredoxin